MKLHFITFADGITPKYMIAASKLCKMVEETGLFSSIKCYSLYDLQEDSVFWSQHKDFFARSPRGFGYWLWKPYIVKKGLSNIPEGDILLYLDSCTTFNTEGKQRFLEYVNMLLASPQKSFFIEMSHDLPIRHWTKAHTVNQLDAQNLVDLPVVIAGILMISNTRYNCSLFEFIYNTCCDYSLLDDSPCEEPNDPTFRDHRHDQSIMSILLRKLAPSSIVKLEGEWYFPNKEAQRIQYPFWIQSNNY